MQRILNLAFGLSIETETKRRLEVAAEIAEAALEGQDGEQEETPQARSQ